MLYYSYNNYVDCIHHIANWRASVASETLTGVTQLKIGDVCLFIYLYICIWRASEASERVLGVDNAKSYVGWYVCPLNARAGNFFSKKHGFLGLTPVYSETTALSKPYFILKLQSVRKFL